MNIKSELRLILLPVYMLSQISNYKTVDCGKICQLKNNKARAGVQNPALAFII